MSRSGMYSPLEVSRRWIKSPWQRVSTSSFSSSAVKSTRKSCWSTLSRITCSPSKTKTSEAVCCHADEAKTPFIFWVDEKYPNNAKKKETYVDPFSFEAAEEKSNLGASCPVSFEIVGTIRCIPTLDTIIENEQQEQASFDPFEMKTYTGGQENSFDPTSINIIEGIFDCSSELVPVRLFPDDKADSDDVLMKTDCGEEENGFDTASFEEDSIDVNITEEDESVWVDSSSIKNGFTKAKDFQSHDWGDETD